MPILSFLGCLKLPECNGTRCGRVFFVFLLSVIIPHQPSCFVLFCVVGWVVVIAPPLPDTCAEKLLLVSILGWAEGLPCADLGAMAPIGASRNLLKVSIIYLDSLPCSIWNVALSQHFWNCFALVCWDLSESQAVLYRQRNIYNQASDILPVYTVLDCIVNGANVSESEG